MKLITIFCIIFLVTTSFGTDTSSSQEITASSTRGLQPDNFYEIKSDLEQSDRHFNKLMEDMDDAYYPKVKDNLPLSEFKTLADVNDRIETSIADSDRSEVFQGIVDENHFVNESNSTFSFKQIPESFRDSRFNSMEEIPVDDNIKRQIVDYLILPRTNTYNGLGEKYRKLLFFGYSLETMRHTARTIAFENRWLFHEYFVADLLIHFTHNDDLFESTPQENPLKNLFKSAAFESKKKNKPFLLIVNNIEGIISASSKQDSNALMYNIRYWLLSEMKKYLTPQNPLEEPEETLADLIVIFTSSHPNVISEILLQKLVQKAIFFDFPTLRIFKVLFTNELLEFKICDGMYDSQSQGEEEEGEDDGNGNGRRVGRYENYEERSVRSSSRRSKRNYDDDYRFKKSESTTPLQVDGEASSNEFDKVLEHDDYLVKQLEAKASTYEDHNRQETTSFLEISEKYGADRPRSRDEGEEEEGEEEGEENICNIKKKESYSIIKRNNLQIWVERKKKCNPELNQIFSSDNIVMIKGHGLCLIFNNEMEKFIKDHAVAVKSNYYTSHYYDKPGYILEDIRLVLRSIIRKRHEKMLQKKKSASYQQSRGRSQQQQKPMPDGSENSQFEDRYGFQQNQEDRDTETGVEEEGEDKREFNINNVVFKDAIFSTKVTTPLSVANDILNWATMHNYFQAKMQDLTSNLSEILLGNSEPTKQKPAIFNPTNKMAHVFTDIVTAQSKKQPYEIANTFQTFIKNEGSSEKGEEENAANARLEALTDKFQKKLQEFDKKMKELETLKERSSALNTKASSTGRELSKNEGLLQIPSKTLAQIITDAKNKVREEEQQKYNEKLKQIKEEIKASESKAGSGFRGSRKSEKLQNMIQEAKKEFPENVDEHEKDSKKDLAGLLADIDKLDYSQSEVENERKTGKWGGEKIEELRRESADEIKSEDNYESYNTFPEKKSQDRFADSKKYKNRESNEKKD